MKKHLYILLASVVALLASCGNGNKSSNAESTQDSTLINVTKEQFSAMKMEITSLQTSAFNSTVKVSGQIIVPPKNMAKVTSFIGGHVKSISLLVGDKVAKGQPLLTLESPEYLGLQQSYLEVVGQLGYLKSEYERQKTLFDEQISSQKKYLEAESNYKSAQASYQSLRQRLNMLRINPANVERGKFSSTVTVYSPISGSITTINSNVGMAVSPADIIMEIVDPQAMYLQLSVFEKDVFNAKLGQQVMFTVPQVGTEEFGATVSQIGKTVQGDNRVLTVNAALDAHAKQNLMPGMFVDAQLITGSANKLSIPFDAVATQESNNFLLVLVSEKDGTYSFRKTLVTTGERNGNNIEVIPNTNVKQGTRILAKGVYDVM